VEKRGIGNNCGKRNNYVHWGAVKVPAAFSLERPQVEGGKVGGSRDESRSSQNSEGFIKRKRGDRGAKGC